VTTTRETYPSPPEVTEIPLNVIGTFGQLSELTAEAVRAARDAELAGDSAVLVLRAGGGRVHVPGRTGIHQVSKWEQALRRLERLPTPIVALTQGVLNGPGMEAMLVADFRIATVDMVVDLSQADGTLWPGMAVHRLAQQIGVARARRLVLFGLPIGAAEAAEIGLVDELVASGPAAEEALADAVQLAAGTTGPDLAIRRRLLMDAVTTEYEESLGAHLSACDRALALVARPADVGGPS
jgi:isomerase DpgB